ncbi:Anhydro-N-acetylmuramic acid kinase [Planctomycetes bacterium Pla163]|uniref:Anhydro-N-acetylmuramic acid kinase n=1 Tax=Rohdeia mirabilis TaxID=2528008 RepID=A0A518D0Q7_9BACT|nr:Anhydro-N-acetylmuramic acid kinase [Planctomycetes bacterium Pla163]
MNERLAIGCMTGTSLDGLDVALVRARGTGLELEVELIDARAFDLGELREPLLDFARGGALTALGVADLARRFGELHAAAVVEVARGRALSLVAVHGQTVAHAPPNSLQLVNPWPIVRDANARVVADLRGADLAAGGEGAPITPLADLVLFGHEQKRRAIVNLGGFANVTHLPAVAPGARAAAGARITGGDVTPCNHWLDGLARHLFDRPFDEDGALAATGHADAATVARFADELTAIRSRARSMGSAEERADLERLVGDTEPHAALASAVQAIAAAVADSARDADEVLLAGGSTANRALVDALAAACHAPVHSTSAVGIDARWREAIAMAVLGLVADDGVPITLAAVTGATRPPRAGAWYRPG